MKVDRFATRGPWATGSVTYGLRCDVQLLVVYVTLRSLQCLCLAIALVVGWRWGCGDVGGCWKIFGYWRECNGVLRDDEWFEGGAWCIFTPPSFVLHDQLISTPATYTHESVDLIMWFLVSLTACVPEAILA